MLNGCWSVQKLSLQFRIECLQVAMKKRFILFSCCTNICLESKFCTLSNSLPLLKFCTPLATFCCGLTFAVVAVHRFALKLAFNESQAQSGLRKGSNIRIFGPLAE